jgi:hypothetical protein
MDILTFADVQAAIKRNPKRKFSLMLGNGFSMAYDPSIFSYNALHGYVDKVDDSLLKALFSVVDTHDFERVMQQLDVFAAIGDVLRVDDALKGRIKEAREALKRSLIDAVRALHPEHVYKVPEAKCASCAAFLQTFLGTGGSLFTTNYDLLMYWVLMRSSLHAVDGFGRDRESPDEYVEPEDLEYSELRWGRNAAGQNVYYVHGSLPLFDTGVEIIKEEYDQDYLLEQITKRIVAGHYPVFVTAGDATQKLTTIRHNPYLQDSYESLASVGGSLVTFGFNFGAQDAHIVSAIQRASKQAPDHRLWSIYIGVFSDADADRMARLSSEFKCKVHLYDSKTVGVWG